MSNDRTQNYAIKFLVDGVRLMIPFFGLLVDLWLKAPRVGSHHGRSRLVNNHPVLRPVPL